MRRVLRTAQGEAEVGPTPGDASTRPPLGRIGGTAVIEGILSRNDAVRILRRIAWEGHSKAVAM